MPSLKETNRVTLKLLIGKREAEDSEKREIKRRERCDGWSREETEVRLKKSCLPCLWLHS